MGLGKTIRSHPLGQAALARLASGYIRFVAMTSRVSCDMSSAERCLEAHGRVIGVFWHGRLMMMPLAWKEQRSSFRMMISDHRDGVLIAQAISHFGLDTVPINSKSTGLSALRQMQRHLGEGINVGLTPDGPRGPARKVKMGVITLARLTGLPIVPASFSATRLRKLKSWDSFRFALPFGRIEILSGEPIYVPRDADPQALEAARLLVEERLDALNAETDRRCGQPEQEAPGTSPKKGWRE